MNMNYFVYFLNNRKVYNMDTEKLEMDTITLS